MTVRPQELATLCGPTEPPCVSIFLGIEATAPGGPRDRQRLARLVASAESLLREAGARAPDVDEILSPLRGMTARGPWRGTGATMALYAAPGAVFHRFDLRSPVADQVVVADRFILWPLVREVVREDRFCLLAMSRKQVRLFAGDASGLRQLRATAKLPNFADIVAGDEAEAVLQVHSTRGGPSAVAGIHHGHGGLKDVKKSRTTRWLQVLAKAVDQELRNATGPLVLAGVGEEIATFRAMSRHPAILAAGLTGNPDRLSVAQLHERALPLVRDWHDQERNGDIAVFEERADTAWTAVGVDEVLAAGGEGRIDVLFLGADPDPEFRNALDGVAAALWAGGGRVHVVDGVAPGGAAASAIMRHVAVPPLQGQQTPVGNG